MASSGSSPWGWTRSGACSSWCIPSAGNPCGSFRPARPARAKRRNTMREDYDFSKGKRGAVIATPGKKRITIYLDADVIDSFQKQAEQKGVGYQTLINAALREASSKEPVTLDALRRVIREELHAA
ncbi:MAG: BrnA antitoxin family protein [Betaproteobacteria bacterium]|nr:BrnA antitoxin family protein [Betaproteobacteria bacterium]